MSAIWVLLVSGAIALLVTGVRHFRSAERARRERSYSPGSVYVDG